MSDLQDAANTLLTEPGLAAESLAVGQPCAGCASTVPPDALGLCPTPTCRQFRTGNLRARASGVRAFETKGAATLPPELREAADGFYSGLEADQGGASELTTIGAGYVRRLAEVETICRLLGADLQARGLFTQRGRVRSTYGAFMQAIDRWDKLAQRLGLTRKSRPVPTVAEYLAAHDADRRETP